jgi:hypothetical protein
LYGHAERISWVTLTSLWNLLMFFILKNMFQQICLKVDKLFPHRISRCSYEHYHSRIWQWHLLTILKILIFKKKPSTYCWRRFSIFKYLYEFFHIKNMVSWNRRALALLRWQLEEDELRKVFRFYLIWEKIE